MINEDVQTIVGDIEKNRETLDWDIDGAVVKINSLQARAALGYTDKFPRWAVACKFPALEMTTLVEDVVWQVGRTGRVTPLALVSAVELAGVQVTRATLNNPADLRRKNVKIGGRVFIRRSNDVIPEIMGAADETGRDIEIPQTCPACGAPLEENGPLLFCLNAALCPAQRAERIAHFASRAGMDIEGFSDKTARAAIAAGLEHPSELYTKPYEFWVCLPGFAAKKAENLLAAIEGSKRRPLHQFLSALGIPNTGKATARTLAEAFGTPEALMSATRDDLAALPDIGPVVAQGIFDFFADPAIRREIAALLAAGVSPPPAEKPKTGGLSGRTFCLTGTLPTLTREQAHALILQHGGKVTGSVSAKTGVLLAGDAAGSKLQKARDLGIEIWTQDDLISQTQH